MNELLQRMALNGNLLDKLDDAEGRVRLVTDKYLTYQAADGRYGKRGTDDPAGIQSVLNAKTMFGAVGDGVEDDNEAVEACLEAAMATGVPAYFPRGTYICNDVRTSSGAATDTLTIVGDGPDTVIKMMDGATTNLFFVTTIGGLYMRDLTLDGNKSGAPSSGLALVRTDVDNSHFRNVTFRDSVFEGVYFSPGSASLTSKLSVIGCQFLDNDRYGIAAQNGRDIVIVGNIALGCGAGLIDIEPDAVGEVGAEVVIVGNTARNSGSAVPTAGVIQVFSTAATANAVRRAVIGNNIVNGGSKTGIRVSDCIEVAVTGNVVTAMGKYGIYIAGDTQNANITCVGNVVRSCGQEAANTYDGIACTRLIDSVVMGNSISDGSSNHRYHLFVDGNSARCVIGPNVLGPGAQTGRWSIGGTDHAILPGAGLARTFADGDATPSVANGHVFACANTGATNITFFDDGMPGQVIHVRVDANTTLVDSATLRLAGNFAGASNRDMISLVMLGSAWHEISRSAN